VLELTLFILVAVISYAGVLVFRPWSEQKGIVDLPNERSSHITPTPRGGGLVIASVSIAGYLAIMFATSQTIFWGYVMAAIIVVSVSWLDDLYSISSVWRLVCHFGAAILFTWSCGHLQSIQVPGLGYSVDLGPFGAGLTVLWIVWFLNAYNFMDGIDGIAGLQAVLAGLGWSVVAFYGSANGAHLYGLILAAAALGFLVQNWQPARIFMGDTGSAFLGFTFAAMPVLATRESDANEGWFALSAVALVWFFVFDSLLTFWLRLFRGERVWVAHREHIYQRLVRAGHSHGFVAGLYGVLAAIVVILFLTSARTSGIFTLLPLSITLIVSFALAAYAVRKKLLT